MSDNDVVVEGKYPHMERWKTGLYSLDCALASRTGELGMPARSGVFIHGFTHVGKSTLTYYLSGRVPDGKMIVLLDLEGLDSKYLASAVKQSGFRGKVKLVDPVIEKKAVSHRKMVQAMLDMMENNPTARACILDSVGVYMPFAEVAGDIGESFMGKRAHEFGQFARRATALIQSRDEDFNYFVISHTHSVIGGQGHNPAGGEVIKSLCPIILYLWQKETLTKSVVETDKEPIAYLVAGKVEKLRYGGKGRQFQFVILPGIGVSPEMSAVFDCLTYGLATKDGAIKLNGKSVGFMPKLVDAAINKTKERFEPFFEALTNRSLNLKEDEVEPTPDAE